MKNPTKARRFLCDLIDRKCGLGRIKGVEVGVSKGETSAALLRHFPKLTLYMVDAWAVYPEDHPYRKSGDGHARLTAEQQSAHAQAAFNDTLFANDRRTILQGDSVAKAKYIVNGSLDFAFVDDDHTYEGVLRSLRAWWPKLRTGGLLCGDDMGHRRDTVGLFGVTKAVNEFAAEVYRKVCVYRGKTIWWLE
jgi:hypothetical protein